MLVIRIISYVALSILSYIAGVAVATYKIIKIIKEDEKAGACSRGQTVRDVH